MPFPFKVIPPISLFLVIMGVVLFLTPEARAQARRKPQSSVGVFAFAMDPMVGVDAARVESAMKQAVQQRKGWHHLDVESVVAPKEWARMVARQRETEDLLRKGFVAYHNGRYGLAKEIFESAVRVIDENAPYVRSIRPLLIGLHFLGATAFLAEVPREGVQWFSRAVSMAPQVRMDDEVFPPTIIELFERVRSAPKRGDQPGSLEISSTPSGARIFLNGQPVGVTPDRVTPPETGLHLLAVEMPGYLRWGRVVEVLPEVDSRLEVPLDALGAVQPQLDSLLFQVEGALDSYDVSPDGSIIQLGGLLQVDHLIMAQVVPRTGGRSLVVGYHFDIVNRRLVNKAEIIVDGQSASTKKVVEFTRQLIEADGDAATGFVGADSPTFGDGGEVERGTAWKPAEDGAAQPKDQPRAHLKSASSRWWVWGLVGAAVVGGGGAGTYYLLTADADGEAQQLGRVVIQF